MTYNIATIQNGFIFKDETYLFGTTQIYDENENIIEVSVIPSIDSVLVATDKGVIYLDLSCTIHEVEFSDINLFIKALKGE